MREKQPWMQKGALVIKSGQPGVIENFAESKIGNQTYVHTIHVKMNGCNRAFPFNPNDIDAATAFNIPVEVGQRALNNNLQNR